MTSGAQCCCSSRRWPSIVAITAIVWALGCGRVGYEVEQMRVASSNDSDPFGGASSDGVLLGEGDARLARRPTFLVEETHLPQPVSSPAACPQDKDVYLAGGSDGFLSTTDCTRDMHVFEQAGSLVTFADELPIANQGLGLLHADGSLLSVMGFCGGTPEEEQSVFRHLEGGSEATLVGMFPEGAYHAASGVLLDAAGASTIVAAGGYGSGPLRDLLQVMAVADGSARLMDVSLPSNRCLAAGVSTGDTFYVLGGSTYVDCVPPSTSPTLEMTDEVVAVQMSPDQAEVVGRLPEPLAAACAVKRADGQITIFGGLHYVADGMGGFRRELSDAVYLFDPTTGEAKTHAATLPEPRAAMGCAWTPDDRTLLFGGAGPGGTPTDEILLFEPYSPVGTLTGDIDSGLPDTRWVRLTFEAWVLESASLTFAVRVSADGAWSDATAGWADVSPDGALPASLPQGRYAQWRATFRTDSPSETPSLHRVELRFIPGG